MVDSKFSHKSIAIEIQNILNDIKQKYNKSDLEISQLIKENNVVISRIRHIANNSEKKYKIKDEYLISIHEKLNELTNRLESVEEDNQYKAILGYYRAFTLPYDGNPNPHDVIITKKKNGKLSLKWGDEINETSDFNYEGDVNITGSKMFVELESLQHSNNVSNITHTARKRYLICHVGLFDNSNEKKEVLTGLMTRCRSNGIEIISYRCLFIKIDDNISNIDSLKKSIINEEDSFYKDKLKDAESRCNIFFDKRYFRDLHYNHCLTVGPVEDFNPVSIIKNDVYQRERENLKELVGIYENYGNTPNINNRNEDGYKVNLGYLQIKSDGKVKIKTSNYYYEGTAKLYLGENILEISAHAYNKSSEIIFNNENLNQKEFGILMILSLGDSKEIVNVKWMWGVTVGVFMDNSPLAMRELLNKVDVEDIKNKLRKDNLEENDYDDFFLNHCKPVELRKENIKNNENFKKTNPKGIEIENLAYNGLNRGDILQFFSGRTDNYIKSFRDLNHKPTRPQYAYQIYFDAAYGEYTKLSLFNNDMSYIDEESEYLYNFIYYFRQAIKHGYDYEKTQNFDTKFYEIFTKKIMEDNKVNIFFIKNNNDTLTIDITKLPKNKDDCFRLLFRYYNKK